MSRTTLQDAPVDPLSQPEPEYSPGWHEQQGDHLRGALIARDWRIPDDADRERYRIYTLELAEGCRAKVKDGETAETVAVHATRTQLARKLALLDPPIGAVLSICYSGPPEGTAKSHRYRVAVLRGDRWVEARTRFGSDGEPTDYLAELRNGQFVEVEPASHVHAPPFEADARTQAALEAEREARDVAASDVAW